MQNTQEALFQDMLDKNSAQILRICSVYGQDADEKQDLFQEVVINLWKSLPSFKGNAALSTWVYRVALNVCMQNSLKIKRHQSKHVKLDSIHYEIPPHHEDAGEEQERINQLYTCIKQLPDIDRNLVMLSLEDLPYKEIAEITGITENHVAVRMKRLKERLFTCLNSKYER